MMSKLVPKDSHWEDFENWLCQGQGLVIDQGSGKFSRVEIVRPLSGFKFLVKGQDGGEFEISHEQISIIGPV